MSEWRSDAVMADANARDDRRTSLRLRELVDEMLASLRVVARRDLWTPEERRAAEDELAGIMEQVRFEAVWKGRSPAPRDQRTAP